MAERYLSVSDWKRKFESVKAFSEAQIWAHKHLIHFTLFFFLTGLPLISKDWFGWLAYVYGYPLSTIIGPAYDPYSLGMQVARFIHRLSALGLALVLIPFLFRMLRDIGKSEIWPECWSASCFSKGVRDLIDYYVHKKKVEFPKYNLGQKGWIWTAAIGMIIMYLTGIVMWLRDFFSPGLWETAHILHDIGFFIAAIGLIIHVYMAILIPEHRPFVRAMFRTGRLTEEYVEEHHPKWHEKMEKS